MKRALFIIPSPVPPPFDGRFCKFNQLSKTVSGDVLIPLGKNKNEIDHPLNRNNIKFNYSYGFFYTDGFSKAIKQLAFYISTGLRLNKENKFDLIICYGTNIAGISAVILKLLLRIPLILEIPGHPTKGLILDKQKVNLASKIKIKIAEYLLTICCKNANIIKLLYPWQLSDWPKIQSKYSHKIKVFHDFIASNEIHPNKSNKVIQFVGYPWHLKGVDILIKAFLEITKEFPDFTLDITGYCPPEELKYFEKLANNNPKIIFCRPVPNEEIIKKISNSYVFILPSRTEAMGRVLLEAMFAAKPIIASNVDGIPHYIHDEVNGFLFEAENTKELQNKLKVMLSSKELAVKIGKKGLEIATKRYSENEWLKNYQNMIDNL